MSSSCTAWTSRWGERRPPRFGVQHDRFAGVYDGINRLFPVAILQGDDQDRPAIVVAYLQRVFLFGDSIARIGRTLPASGQGLALRVLHIQDFDEIR